MPQYKKSPEVGEDKSSNGRFGDASRGVVYVVTGGRSYIGELLSSVRSLRKFEPDLPVLVFTDFSIPDKHGMVSERLEFQDNAHKLKVSSLRRSPFEETLFLDTDTLIRGSLSALFEELKGRDFCAANAHLADYSVRPPRLFAMAQEGEYNTGVLLFRRSDATGEFLKRWEEAVRAHDSANMWAGHFGDQYFFNELLKGGAIDTCGLSWGVIENLRWNCRGIAIDEVVSQGRWSEVHILHKRTNGMKLRKLAFSISDYSTVRVLLGKASGQVKKLLPTFQKVEADRT